jgi:acyl-coenzyme A synthetase/AMP-(fatty) acid ligase
MVLYSKLPPVELERKSIIDFLFSSKKVPENYELFFDALTGQSLTWAQLKNEVLRFSAGLQEKFNFKKGDVVSIFAPNQVSFL